MRWGPWLLAVLARSGPLEPWARDALHGDGERSRLQCLSNTSSSFSILANHCRFCSSKSLYSLWLANFGMLQILSSVFTGCFIGRDVALRTWSGSVDGLPSFSEATKLLQAWAAKSAGRESLLCPYQRCTDSCVGFGRGAVHGMAYISCRATRSYWLGVSCQIFGSVIV